ncbi:MAG TPA: hypothetical protein VD816_06610 [Ohtaekwangia sp.]|nr:hypothetical protein [Ohtaekwangia sp.]
MKKFLSMLVFAGMVASFVACDDDEGTPDGPSITAPAVTNVQASAAADISFAVTSPGGYKSVTISQSGGTAAKKSEPAAGATSGNIVVTFTAGEGAGAGSVTIAVTDNNSKTETETAAVNITEEAVPDIVVVAGLIEEDVTWTADNIYELAGRVIVNAGATLTIEAGTVIKGRTGDGANASALMIARGGKIEAVGTAENPIIMTSVLDDIQPGQTSGTELDVTDRGKWGGLVILGKAPISFSGATEAQIEGVPAGEPLGLYGGNVSDDNSGTVQFVSIRHGGTELSGGNEINGLTLGGVGSGTTISDIEIFANFDDGVEFFGGSVNVSNILVSYQGDDGIDIDQAYSGTIDGFMVVHGASTNQGLEIDGPEGTDNADGKFTLKNGTLIGHDDVANLADFKSKAQGTIENVLFSGYAAGKKIMIAASYDGSCNSTSNAYKNLVDGNLEFTDVQFTTFTVDVYASSGSCDTAADDATAAGLVSSGTATGGPAISTWGWSVSADQGLLE